MFRVWATRDVHRKNIGENVVYCLKQHAFKEGFIWKCTLGKKVNELSPQYTLTIDVFANQPEERYFRSIESRINRGLQLRLCQYSQPTSGEITKLLWQEWWLASNLIFFCSPQIAMMTSVYSTIVMSFERYVRICHTCRLRSCKYITEENFKWVVGGKMGIFRLYVKSSSLGYSVSYQKSKRWLTFFLIQFIGGYIRPIQHILCPPAGLNHNFRHFVEGLTVVSRGEQK